MIILARSILFDCFSFFLFILSPMYLRRWKVVECFEVLTSFEIKNPRSCMSWCCILFYIWFFKYILSNIWTWIIIITMHILPLSHSFPEKPMINNSLPTFKSTTPSAMQRIQRSSIQNGRSRWNLALKVELLGT